MGKPANEIYVVQAFTHLICDRHKLWKLLAVFLRGFMVREKEITPNLTPLHSIYGAQLH